MLVLCALSRVLIRHRFAIAKRSRDNYEKGFVLDDFRVKNEGIKTIFSISNRSLRLARELLVRDASYELVNIACDI